MMEGLFKFNINLNLTFNAPLGTSDNSPVF